MFLLDEAWLFIRNETIRNYVTQAQKTCRKNNAAMLLATQSVKELATSGMLTVVAERCSTKIFLANPDMDPQVYRDAFGLNNTELSLIGSLVLPSQMLIRKPTGSKTVLWVIKTSSVVEIVMRESTDSSWSLHGRWANDR
jgi:type IV secretory pathway VirB4 component